MEKLQQVIKRFKGEIYYFTPAQVAYIERMFLDKGPVLIRIGEKKNTRFFSPGESQKLFERGNVFDNSSTEEKKNS
jgi:hypothetical protein